MEHHSVFRCAQIVGAVSPVMDMRPILNRHLLGYVPLCYRLNNLLRVLLICGDKCVRRGNINGPKIEVRSSQIILRL